MKKGIITLFILLVLMSLGLIGSCLAFSEKLPDGKNQQAADALAEQMLKAINDSAWQETGAVSWTFMGKHAHLWDRKRNLAQVKWKDNEVYFNINTKKGKAFVNDREALGKEKDKLIDKAWKHWVNDSFWLNPISKIFDDGTSRSLVKLKDGREGLKISYAVGGSTPGDSYVWILDENKLPTAWKIWVSIIPVKGIEIPWTQWITTETGVKICILHDAVVDIELSDVKTAFTLKELTREDPFSILEQ